jgi:hypothetical protein
MRIWKLFQRHYEQRVLHKPAKCWVNENMEIVSKALYRTILHKAAKKHRLHTAANLKKIFAQISKR